MSGMGFIPNEKQAIPEIEDLISDFLDVDREKVRGHVADDIAGVDLLVKAANYEFIIEYRSSASAGTIAGAAEQLKCHSFSIKKFIPLVAVPYMGKVGREMCNKAGVSWLDLSGNGKITAPNLRIWIEGRPNKYSRRGRPPNLFAPKSSRIVRQLLLSWDEYQSQADLARATELDDGYVSKLVRRLANEKLVIENKKGAIRPSDPTLLLDAWESEYDFTRQQIVKGHVATRTGEALVRQLAVEMARLGIDYAATGLGAAWLYTHFVSHRMVTFYLRSRPSKKFLEEIKFWDEEKGANTWFVVPNDEGVFHGSKVIDDVNCVNEVQVYLDLKNHPERAKEAAEELRSTYLNWDDDENVRADAANIVRSLLRDLVSKDDS